MVVERARGESQVTSGSLQSLCWGSSATGGIVSAYFSGYFVATYGVRFVQNNRNAFFAFLFFSLFSFFLSTVAIMNVKVAGSIHQFLFTIA